MKKLICTILCLLVCFATYGQTEETQHLTFKNIPIDGTPTAFGNKLKAVGFTFDFEDDQGAHWYQGTFAGYNNCNICVKYSQNLVYEIVVLFPECYSWNMLNNSYQSLKNMLISKYGDPFANEEKFENIPSYRNINDDNDKFEEVKNDHCVYYTVINNYVNGMGTIILEIKTGTPRVGLHYIDYINNSAKDAAALNDL